MRRILILALLTAVAPCAWAIPYEVDPFSSTDMNIQTPNGVLADISNYVAAATAWGGVRGYRLQVTQVTTGNAELIVNAALGIASYNNDSGTRGALTLSYGSLVPLGGGTALGEDWTGIDGLRVLVTDLEAGPGALLAQVDAGGTVYTSLSVPLISAGTYVAYFDDFTPAGLPAALGSVDGVSYSFSGPPSFDVSVDLVGLTPEATTLALLGVGLLAVARRRRGK